MKNVERRMRVLIDVGFLEHDRLLHEWPRVHWLSRAGMRAAGLTGAVVEPKVAELDHDLEVVELAHHLAQLQPTHRMVTEREIRRVEPNPAAGPEAGVHADIARDQQFGTGRGTGGRAFPDLVSVSDDGAQVWVHELERSRKPGPRLERIMLAYAFAEHITGVVYWAFPALVGPVQAAADAANARAREAGRGPAVVVREWTPA